MQYVVRRTQQRQVARFQRLCSATFECDWAANVRVERRPDGNTIPLSTDHRAGSRQLLSASHKHFNGDRLPGVSTTQKTLSDLTVPVAILNPTRQRRHHRRRARPRRDYGRSEPGRRPRGHRRQVRVTAATSAGNVITVTVNQPGDFSAYTLRLITSPTNLRAARRLRPAAVGGGLLVQGGLSQRLRLCRPETICPAEPLPEPEINYSGQGLRQLPPVAARPPERHHAVLARAQPGRHRRRAGRAAGLRG